MNTCVFFKVAEGHFQSRCDSISAEVLSDISMQLRSKGFLCGDVGQGIGCPSAFVCHLEDKDITILMSTVVKSSRDISSWASIACWEDTVPLFRKIFRCRKQTAKGRIADVCGIIHQVLNSDNRFSELKWTSLAEWSKTTYGSLESKVLSRNEGVH